MPSEFELIDRYFVRATPGTVLGPGDDCALLAASAGKQLAVTTDMLVAGTHFLPDVSPRDLGWKTLAVNLSDLAAMGALPRWVLLAGSLPRSDEAWIEDFSAGFFDCAGRFGVDVVGGDLTRGPLNFCVTAIGEITPGQALTRAGARAGDDLWVSGVPGRAALGLAQRLHGHYLPPAVADDCHLALDRPTPRVELGLALVGIATAAIDVSDGLLADLGHILEKSGVGAEVCADTLPALDPGIDPAVARPAQLAGGDDYELVFAAAPQSRDDIQAIGDRLGIVLTRFGSVTAEPTRQLRVVDATGNAIPIDPRGYDHFGSMA